MKKVLLMVIDALATRDVEPALDAGELLTPAEFWNRREEMSPRGKGN